MVPTSLQELCVFAVILALGGIIYLLGNWLFGAPDNGGKRLLLFIIGIIFSAIGGGLVAGFVLYEAARSSSAVFAMLFGSAFLLFGIYLLGMSFFASRETIAKIFERVLSGL